MKKVAIACIAAVALSTGLAAAADPALRAVAKVEGFTNLFQAANIFIAGQPTLEELRWLKAAGVTLVVNIRSEAENKEFAATAFNEENMVKELGLAYASLPVGEKETFSPKTVDGFATLLAGKAGKVLLHCASAGRATHLWMAYLVRHCGFDVNEAALVGRQMKFNLPFEDFLGGRILMRLEETEKN
ncbi:MAG: sulfur transferase domain-containing protein [Candidatus Aminicenantales bacterium]